MGFSILDVRGRHAEPLGLGYLEVLECYACANLVQYQDPTLAMTKTVPLTVPFTYLVDLLLAN